MNTPSGSRITDPHAIVSAFHDLWGPLAPRHILRERLSDGSWVRFHSLPESQRYANTETEWQILLGRHHELLGWLRLHIHEGEVPPHNHLIVFTAEFSDSCDSIPDPELFHRWGLAQQEHIYSACSTEYDPEDASDWWIHFYAGRISDDLQSLEPLLRDVADDQLHNVVLAPPSLSWLFVPYDGGMDIYTHSPTDLAALTSNFSAWLSPHPLGL